MIRLIKNICLTVGAVATMVSISATPHMVKWLLATYILFAVALWMGDDNEDL